MSSYGWYKKKVYDDIIIINLLIEQPPMDAGLVRK